VPALVAPPDGSVSITRSVTLTWESGAGWAPDGYNLELDGQVITTTQTSTATVLAAGAHAWRVRAFNLAGYSAYSDPWSFEVVDPPETPIQQSPADTAIITNPVVISWQAGAGGLPDGYELELDGNVITTTSTTYTATLSLGAHFWRVRAYNLAGYSDYSSPWSFQVVELPGVPQLLAPAAGAFLSDGMVDFTWEPGAGGAPQGYEIEIDGVAYTTTSASFSTDLTAGDHSWRVRAYVGPYYSDFSESRMFTIGYRLFLPMIQR
jgi:hypothetical protein